MNNEIGTANHKPSRFDILFPIIVFSLSIIGVVLWILDYTILKLKGASELWFVPVETICMFAWLPLLGGLFDLITKGRTLYFLAKVHHKDGTTKHHLFYLHDDK